ncbi:uncharacterized protein LOC122683073 [Cervus elaphus]|uniref:uncharacterized protein LOC122683073 n=1 Tax=Cervus elaphus TaxID=9860 RepID=UPI001CC2C8EA|nr:uncharacterized protein LOC122683073 [Cervus elaphus]
MEAAPRQTRRPSSVPSPCPGPSGSGTGLRDHTGGWPDTSEPAAWTHPSENCKLASWRPPRKNSATPHPLTRSKPTSTMSKPRPSAGLPLACQLGAFAFASQSEKLFPQGVIGNPWWMAGEQPLAKGPGETVQARKNEKGNPSQAFWRPEDSPDSSHALPPQERPARPRVC